MGGTDITCGISGLPIKPDDPMRFIFLRQPAPNYKSDHDHPWALWLPVSLPVRGVYDFYGRVEKVEQTPFVKFIAEVIGRYAIPLPEDEMTDYGDLKDFPNTIESLMAACERGFLSVKISKDPDDNLSSVLESKISPFYVSEEMWQACIHNIEDEGKGVSTFRHRIVAGHRMYEDAPGGGLRAAYDWPKRLAEMKTLHEKHGILDDDFLDTMGSVNSFGLRDLTSNIEMTPDILGVGTNWKPDVSTFKSLADFTAEDWKRFDEAAIDLRVFDCTLRYNLRREWFPTLARGQYHFPDDELISQRMLARKIEEQAVAIGERYMEENPDYRESIESE